MSVADVMTSMPVTSSSSASIDEAAWLMLEHRVGGLPVLHYGRLVGVITHADLVARLVPRERVRWWRVLIDHERLARECQRARGTTVGEVMSRPAMVVAADDAIEVAAVLLHAHAIGRLPVVDGGDLVGIVTHSDLLRTLTGARPTRPRPDGALVDPIGGRGTHPVCLIPDRLSSEEAVMPGCSGTSDLGGAGAVGLERRMVRPDGSPRGE